MGIDASGAARGGAALALLLILGCASDLIAIEGGFRHRLHDYSIRDPGLPWERVEVEGAAIAYRRPGLETMSLRSTCGRPLAAPAIMARHLLIGVDDWELRQAGPVLVAERDGWTQTFDTLRRGVVVRVKTVTLVARGCSFDWVLATAGPFEEAERAFDAWWNSFRLGTEPALMGEGT